jgi:hypothetical protein
MALYFDGFCTTKFYYFSKGISIYLIENLLVGVMLKIAYMFWSYFIIRQVNI